MDAIFFFQKQRISEQRMMRAAVQLLQCKTSFLFWQLWPQQPKNELKWLQYKIYGAIQHREYERQASNIEEIKQQVAELQQTINTAFERHDFCISPGRTETALRWGGKTNHHSLAYSLSHQHIYKDYRNRLMCTEVTVCNISVVFLSQCIWNVV